eukprot:14394590-Ditylum_brightwellii.AAC.1
MAATKAFSPITLAKAYLIINSQPITQNIDTAINSALTLQDLCQYLQQKLHWSSMTIESIHWEQNGQI